MSPALLALLLVVMLAALVPVRRLAVAGWSPGWLFSAWVFYAVGLLIGLRFPGLSRLILPVLLVAFVLPFIAGPERLAGVLGRRRRPPVIIDVTPRPAPGLPKPPPEPPEPPRPPTQSTDTEQEQAAATAGRRPSQRWTPGRPGRNRKPPEEDR